MRLLARVNEFNLKQTEIRGKKIYRCALILDFSGIGWGKIFKKIRLFKKIASYTRGCFPDIVSSVSIFNPPTGFSTILKIVQPSGLTSRKMKVEHAKNYDSLDEIIHPSQRPEAYGGTSQIVPVNFTLTEIP